MESLITAVYAKMLLMRLNSNIIAVEDIKKELNGKIKDEDIDYSINALVKEEAITISNKNIVEVI